MEIRTDIRASDLADMPADMQAELEAVSKSRRDFMKVTGMAAMSAVIAGCAAHDVKVKPMLRKPEGITPGVVYDYASTCQMCSANCGTLMKVRDGRPVKPEGNPDNPLSQGGLCAAGQAQLWGLYNPDRLHGPTPKEEPDGWADLDARKRWQTLDNFVAAALKAGPVRLLTGTVSGPGARAVIEKFCAATGARHVAYDACSAWPIAAAHRDTHGQARVPHYRFENADVVFSFDADFLGNWISPIEFARAWSKGRDLRFGRKSMTRHIQFESRMSTTGACADERFRVRNAERGAVLVDLANRLGGSFGEAGKHPVPAADMDRLAKELQAAGRRGLVVSGSHDVKQQRLINWINHKLGAYGSTLELAAFSQQKLGSDEAMAALVKELEAGSVKTLIVWGVNPAFDLPGGAKFKELLGKVTHKIAIGMHADETASECDWIAADSHPHETWNDFEPVRGLYTLAQPTVQRLWDTRPALQSLLRWAGDNDAQRDYRAWLQKHWETNVLAGMPWTTAVQIGVRDRRAELAGAEPAFVGPGDVSGVGSVATGDGIEIVTYESYNLGDGRHAGNGWLQEMPDPLVRVSWTNFAGMSPFTMEKLGVSEGDMVEVKAGDATCMAPVVRLPGTAEDVVVLPLGYGRTKAGRIVHGMGVEQDAVNTETSAIGDNAFPLAGHAFGSVSKTGKTYHRLALLQTHDSQENRPLAKETALELWLKDAKAGNQHEIPPVDVTLWKRWEYKGHKWGMVVDLNLCTGCHACAIACQVENNVPVVGKDEVWRRREMHWIRIDRYFEDDPTTKYDGNPTNVANPEVVFQPMMCQHCENAPCETVCPVIATSHSDEGLNIQTYNRCIGTRYCANNCPYKVRRFNWFTYKHRDLAMNLVLNPDISIRTQGVMEKCSMCAQRIYDGKRAAALHQTKVEDGSIRTACQQTCPTNAIVFGDQNDKDSVVAKLGRDGRNYAVLAEINTRPAVTYLTKVRNRKAKPHETAHEEKAAKRKANEHKGHDH
ncbi:MAG: 4Fe-4S dicluster domain-containing protein [Planctomycetes bacterium]|nr:4Fe-4S dicluster domain-containing protein [Planctomycetota bacterium]MCW8135559.1 4Fe-4S dicluster domain-containing protein [Planctomycetota bacterium]